MPDVTDQHVERLRLCWWVDKGGIRAGVYAHNGGGGGCELIEV